MADNNTVALGIKPPEPQDFTKTLGAVSSFQMSQAHAALYGLQAARQGMILNALSKFQQSGNPGDLASADPEMAKTLMGFKQAQAEYSGRLAGAYLANPTEAMWQHVINEGLNAKIIPSPVVADGMRKLPPEQRAQVATSIQRAGVSPEKQPETMGAVKGAESAAEYPYKVGLAGVESGLRQRETAARQQGEAEVEASKDRGRAPNVAPAAAAAYGGNAPNATAFRTPEEKKGAEAAATSPFEVARAAAGKAVDVAEAAARQRGTSPDIVGAAGATYNETLSRAGGVAPRPGVTATLPSFRRPEELAGAEAGAKGEVEIDKKARETVRENADAAIQMNNTLDNMRVAAKTFPWMGPGIQTASHWASQLKPIANRFGFHGFDDFVGGSEAFQKNSMELVRKAVRETSARAAVQEFNMIAQAMPSVNMSEQGFNTVANQISAVQDWHLAKHKYAMAHAGDKQWETQFNDSVGPQAFLLRRMSADDRTRFFATLDKAGNGAQVAASLHRQLQFLKDNNLR